MQLNSQLHLIYIAKLGTEVRILMLKIYETANYFPLALLNNIKNISTVCSSTHIYVHDFNNYFILSQNILIETSQFTVDFYNFPDHFLKNILRKCILPFY